MPEETEPELLPRPHCGGVAAQGDRFARRGPLKEAQGMPLTDSQRLELAGSFRWCAAHPAEGPAEVPSVRVADEWNRLQEALLDDYDPCRFQYRAVWVALADLVEGPTCEMDLTDAYKPSDGPEIRTWECSRCGRSCEEAYGSYEHCPHCGARVTRENRNGEAS